jgi:glycosyltransferase involved in cell wall biosynthesis
MKIIHLASGDLWAGAEVQLFHLALRLAQIEGVTLLVVLLNPGQLETELKKFGVNVRVLNETSLTSFAIFWKFNRILRDFKPEVVHTHRTKENVIGGLAAKLNGIKSIRTVHGASEFAFNPVNFRRFIFAGIDRLVGNLFQQRIIAVSDELKQKLQKYYPKSKLVVINNCVDVAYIEKKSKEQCNIPIDPQSFNIAFVGRFVPVKRVDLFYDIAKATILANPKKDIQFYMFGDGPLQEDIKRKIAADVLSERILLHGFVPNTAPVIKQMNLLMFTSDHEGMPMTLLEAMVLGVPVLSRNLTTIRSVLCQGKCGYILKSDDILEYVDLIKSLVVDREDARKRAALAKMEVRNAYSIENNVKQYLRLYKELVP